MTSNSLFTSNRLRYRRPTSADAPALFELDNDPEVMRWINGGQPLVFADFCRDQMPVYLQRWSVSLFGFLIIEVKNHFAGWVSLRPTGHPGEASLGYRLMKKHWGKGYASEAASAVIARGFHDESQQMLNTIVANTYEKNIGSQRVLTKAGMVLIRREQPDIADLAGVDTAIGAGEIWEGDEFYYAIVRDVRD